MHCAVTAQPPRYAQKKMLFTKNKTSEVHVHFALVVQLVSAVADCALVCLWRGCVIQSRHNIINTTYATNKQTILKVYVPRNTSNCMKAVMSLQCINAAMLEQKMQHKNQQIHQFNAAMVVCQSVPTSLDINNVLTTMCKTTLHYNSPLDELVSQQFVTKRERC